MQTFAIKMHNFMRFGEENNSILFDLTQEQKKDIKDGVTTMDALYDEFKKDPLGHVRRAKKRGVTNPIGIKGIIDGNSSMSNGAGKSTILEAICFVRYDRIIRKTANNDKIEKAGTSVVRKINGKYPADLKESYVEEFLEVGGKVYRIKRGRTFSKGHKSHSPILEFECIGSEIVESLSSHRTGDTKVAIEEVITTDYDLFVNSQMFGQNDAGKILIGTDKIRKEMLISLLHLENVVQGCLEKIRNKKNDQQKKVDGIKINIDILEKNVIETLKPYLSDAEKVKAEQGFSPEYPKMLLHEIEKQKCLAEDNSRLTKEKIASIQVKLDSLLKSEKVAIIDKIKEEGQTVRKLRDSKEKQKNDQLAEWEKIKQDNKRSLLEKKAEKLKRQSKIDELQKKVDQKTKDIADFKEEELKLKLEKCRTAMALKSSTELEMENARRDRDKILESITGLQVVIHQHETEILRLKRQIEDVKGDNFVCRECKSTVNRQHIIDKINEAEAQKKDGQLALAVIMPQKAEVVSKIDGLEAKSQKINQYALAEKEIQNKFKTNEQDRKDLNDISSILNDSIEFMKTLIGDIESLETKSQEYDKKCQDIESAFKTETAELDQQLLVLTEKFKNAKKNAETILLEAENVKKEKEEMDKLYMSLVKKIGELSKEIEYQSKQKENIEIKSAALVSETKALNRILLLEDIYGLDGVQTKIIKKYLPLLNVYIKEYLDILSHGKMSVKFEINDRLKVDLRITGATAESFDLLSGGEKMVARLGVDIALTLLSFSRSSQKPEMICLDEIFGPLDASNTSGVFRVLQKLKEKFERVIIISHRPEIQGLSDNNIIVEKDSSANGISIIRGWEN